MNRHLVAGLLALIPVSAAVGKTPATPGAPDTPEFKKTSELIRHLGDNRFLTREAAARQIIDLGRAAKPALLAAAADSDPEVADRCQRLLVQALAADFKARAEAFLADKEGKQEHDIPSWDRFQKEVGAGKESRELFAEMLKTNQNLFIALEQEPKLFPERYAARCQEMMQFIYGNVPQQARIQPTLGDVASLFFFGQTPDAARALERNNLVLNLLYQPPVQNAFRGGGGAAAFRKLFIGWMEARTDVNSISQCLSIVQQHNIKEGLGYASRVVRSRETQVFLRAQALTVIGKMGDKSHVELLEGAFTPAYLVSGAALVGVKSGLGLLAAPVDDDTAVTQFQLNNKRGTVQLRDIALAMAIHLSGQKPQDYGFEFTLNQPNWQQSYYYLGFADDDNDPKVAERKREEARKKWDAFRKAPPKK